MGDLQFVSEEVVKVVIVGAAQSGKSALLNRYVDDIFSPYYISTIGIDFKTANIQISEKDASEENQKVKVKLQLWDTAGQERFKTIAQLYYRNANVFILCVDLSEVNGLEVAKKFYDDVKDKPDNNIPFIVVGTKFDLTKASEGQARIETVQSFCDENKLPFFKTSALNDEGNINDAFVSAAIVGLEHARLNADRNKTNIKLK